MPVTFTTLQLKLGIAHGDLRLVCMQLLVNFMKLQTNSYCAVFDSIGSLELGSEFCN
jgi:hypothetical protein